MLMSGIVYAGSTRIEASLETLTFYINGEPNPHTALIYEGRTYAPVRFISESLGKEVVWDGDTRSIHIGGQTEMSNDQGMTYDDGRYRGIYEDRGVQQVSIQFHLEDNVLKDLSYRHLYHGGNDYLQIEEGHELYPVVMQHQQILDYLEGKPLEAIFDLYTPGAFIEDVDTFTGATIRANKVLSAIRDGLNRGIY